MLRERKDDDCCLRFSKSFLCIINILLCPLGCAMLANGGAMVSAPASYMAVGADTGADLSIVGNGKDVIMSIGIFLVILGGVVMMISAFGPFVAYWESKRVLVPYLVIVIISAVADVALIIFAMVYPKYQTVFIQSEMYQTMIRNFNEDIQLYPVTVISNSNSPYGYNWAMTQSTAMCCGVFGPSDYNQTRYDVTHRQVSVSSNDTTTSSFPISCCSLKNDVQLSNTISQSDFTDLIGCIDNVTTTDKPSPYHTNGCYSRVAEEMKFTSLAVVGIVATTVGFQIIIVIAGCLIYDPPAQWKRIP